MAGLSREGLWKVAKVNVLEIRFVRRDKNRKPRQRRMLMTLDPLLLNSHAGKKILNFRKPNFPPAYDAASKNLLFVWDIVMQDWRAVPVESTVIVRAIPTRSPKNPNNDIQTRKAQADWWEFFNSTILKMTPGQKSAFMDR